jgi:hypothetical protein
LIAGIRSPHGVGLGDSSHCIKVILQYYANQVLIFQFDGCRLFYTSKWLYTLLREIILEDKVHKTEPLLNMRGVGHTFKKKFAYAIFMC